jgi:hypothetical protein
MSIMNISQVRHGYIYVRQNRYAIICNFDICEENNDNTDVRPTDIENTTKDVSQGIIPILT